MKSKWSFVLVCFLCFGMVFAAGCKSSSSDSSTITSPTPTTNNNAQLSGIVKIEGGSNQQK